MGLECVCPESKLPGWDRRLDAGGSLGRVPVFQQPVAGKGKKTVLGFDGFLFSFRGITCES